MDANYLERIFQEKIKTVDSTDKIVIIYIPHSQLAQWISTDFENLH